MKGSYRASSHNRVARDFYQTPWSMVEQLIAVEDFTSPVLEPCAGEGAISSVLAEYGFDVVAYDLWRGDDRRDFLVEHRRFPSIIMNPPFRLANEFVLKAFEITTDKVAALLPLDYLHGKARYDSVYSVRMPNRIYVFVRRPLFERTVRDNGTYKTGSTTFAWFVFDMTTKGDTWPQILWIDNNEWVTGGSQRDGTDEPSLFSETEGGNPDWSAENSELREQDGTRNTREDVRA
ncbi:MAG: hypothetical protein WD492_12825 [Alkalispirochaeta sp.]